MMQTDINKELKMLIEQYIDELQNIKNHINVKYINTFKINTSEDSKNLEILKCIKMMFL